MFDLVIRGGTVVTPHGTGVWDVPVTGERIAAITEPGSIEASQARRNVDASGKHRHPRRRRSPRALQVAHAHARWQRAADRRARRW